MVPQLLSRSRPETGGRRQTIRRSLFWPHAGAVEGKSMLNHYLHHPQLLTEGGDLWDFKASDTVAHTRPHQSITCFTKSFLETVADRSPFFWLIFKPKSILLWFCCFSLHWFAADQCCRMHHKSSLHLRNMVCTHVNVRFSDLTYHSADFEETPTVFGKSCWPYVLLYPVRLCTVTVLKQAITVV